jgi:heavy-metal resistance protein
MKRYGALLIAIMVFVVSAKGYAQQRSPNPQGQQSAGAGPTPELVELLKLLESQQANQGGLGLRGGGGRGLGPADSETVEKLRELERYINTAGVPVTVNVVSGSWWTNPTLVARLGLTEDQKAKIGKSFENHRLTLEANKTALEKEEAQLARLLGAESVDRNAALAQIYRVVTARGEMERTNATMTLEMREHLTLAQWTQLQAQTNTSLRIVPPPPRGEQQTPFGTRGGQRQ